MAANSKLITRSHQIHRWLCSKYKTPYPTVLKWVPRLRDRSLIDKVDNPKGKYSADTYQRNRKIFIRMSIETCGHSYSNMIDTIFHEYAHAMDWRHHRLVNEKHHPRSWGLYYADIYDDFHDGEGHKDSKDF